MVRTFTYPKNCMPAGPSEMILLANPSPSTRGGGVESFWGFTRRQVMRVGAAHVRGGMITRRPLCLLPLIEPPRASTMKLTKKLQIHKIIHTINYEFATQTPLSTDSRQLTTMIGSDSLVRTRSGHSLVCATITVYHQGMRYTHFTVKP